MYSGVTLATKIAEHLANGLFGSSVIDLVRDLNMTEKPLEEKVSQAQQAISNASGVVRELETMLDERAKKITDLKAECRRYEELAQIDQEKVKPLIDQMALTIKKGKGLDIWVNLLINIIAGVIVFLLGVVFGPAITTWWNSLIGSVR